MPLGSSQIKTRMQPNNSLEPAVSAGTQRPRAARTGTRRSRPGPPAKMAIRMPIDVAVEWTVVSRVRPGGSVYTR